MKTLRFDSEEFNYSIRCKVDDANLTQNDIKGLELKIACIQATLDCIVKENRKVKEALIESHRSKLFLCR